MILVLLFCPTVADCFKMREENSDAQGELCIPELQRSAQAAFPVS